MLPSVVEAQYCAQPAENTQYENIVSHSIEQCGNQVSMEVIVNGSFNNDVHYVKIYFDKNQDGTSYETEYDLGSVTYNGSNSTFSLTANDFTNTGGNNYRIVMTFDIAPTGPCDNLPSGANYGDVLDGTFNYDVNGLSASPPNSNVCQGEIINISSNTSGGVPGYNYVWSLTGGTSIGATISNVNNSAVTLNTTGATTGSLDLSLTVTDASGCSDTDVALVNIDGPVVVSAGSDDTFCAEDYVLNGAISGAVNSGTWTGGLGTFFPNAQTLNATYTPTATEFANGSITLTLTSDNPVGTCVAASDDVTLTIIQSATADVGADQILSTLQSVNVTAIANGPGAWSGGAGSFANANALSTTYTPNTSEGASIVTLIWTTADPDGAGSCTSAMDELLIYYGVGDNDGDGVLDGTDLDDDNDGILDADEIQCEGPSSTFSWDGYADNTLPPTDVSPVTIDGVDLTFTQNDVEGALTYTGVNSTYPDGKQWRWLQDVATQTSFTDGAIGFSEPVAGVVLRIGDIDMLANGLGFIDSVTIRAWTNSTVVEILPSMVTTGSAVKYNPGTNTFVGIALNADNQTNGDVIIDFSNQALDSIAFRYQNNSVESNPSQQAIGVYGFDFCKVIDSDNDNVPDYIDPDSDGDGCPDAIEGAGAFVATDLNTNDELAGPVDGMGIPDVATSSGQGIGYSQDASAQDPDCCDNPPTTNAGVDSDVCSDASVNLSGGIGGGATSGTWSGGAGSFIPSSSSLNATYTPTAAELSAGSLTLTLTTDTPGGCPAGSDDITFTFIDPVVVNAGIDQTICEGATTISLNGSISGAIISGTWSGGAGTFSPDATALNATYSPTAAEINSGTISLVLTSDVPSGPCGSAFDAIVISVEEKPLVDAGVDLSSCDNGAVSLNGSITGTVTSGTWSGGAGVFNPNATSLNATYTPTAAEITAGSVILTLTTDLPTGACNSTENDDVIISFLSAPTVDANIISVDCITSKVSLSGSFGGAATSASWSGGLGNFSPNANTLNATYTPTPVELSSGSVGLTLTTDSPGNCLAASEDILVSLGVNIAATPSTSTICAGNDLIVPGNPSGGTGNYVSHVWALGTGTTATGVTLTNGNTENVTVNANTQGAVYLEYTVTDDNGCSATGTTIINVLYSPSCDINGPTTSCNGADLTLQFVPETFGISPPSGSVVSGSQGSLETHVFDGVTSPDEVRVVITLPTWDDSFYETTLNGNVLFPQSDEPQSWGTGGLEINSPWSANLNGLPRTIITITSTSITYEISQNVNSTVMTTVVPTNWPTTPQPFQVGSNTLVFGIKNTAGPTSGSWTLEAFQDLTQTYLWSTGSTADEITVSPTTTTTYSVTVTNSTGCSRTCSQTVVIEDVAVAGSDESICVGGSVQIGQASTPGVTYSWTPITGLSASDIANPIASPSVTTDYTVTATTSAGCVDTDVITVTVDNPTSNASDQSICIGQITSINGQPQGGSGSYSNHQWTELSSTATGYVLTDTDQQTVSINASNASSGTITLRYTADVAGCASIAQDIVVALGPEVSFVGPGVLCASDGTQPLSATPIGGVFSGTGVSGSTFNPTSAGVGTHIITYTYDDGAGCIVSKSDAITVQALPCTNQTCTTVISDDFESGYGNWNDGGNDCLRLNSAANANSGTRSVRLRDNSTTSVVTSDVLDMSLYDEAIIDFTYRALSFEVNEDFFLEISSDGGSTYTIVEDWVSGTDFTNGVREFESVSITGITFTANTVFRFRGDASDNGDRVHLDDIVIQGCITIPPTACTLVSYVGGLSTSGNENDLGTVTIDLEIAAPLATDLNITYYTIDGSANAGSDYVGVVSGVATITAGNTSTSISGTPIQVVVNGDTDVEIDEDFEIVIASNSEVCANPDSILTVTIVNDENSAPILTNIENDNLLYCQASGISTVVTQTITVDEPEGDNLSATVTLTTTTDPAADILSVDLSAYPSASATYSYPTLTIVGTIPPADMQNILRSVEFFTNSNVMGVRAIEFVIDDGTQNSNVGTRNINSDETDVGCCNAAAPSIGK